MKIAIFVAVMTVVSLTVAQMTEEEAIEYLDELNESLSSGCNANMLATWAYVTDVSNSTAQQQASQASVEYLTYRAEVAANVSRMNYEDFSVEVYRKLRFLSDQGPGGLDMQSLQTYEQLQSNMEDIYNNALLCPYGAGGECNLKLEPDLESIMASSTNWDELEYYWTAWRKNTGKLMRKSYMEFAQLSNQAATNDGYEDTGDYWLNGYTVTNKESKAYSTLLHKLQPITADDFRQTTATLWEEVSEKLYKKLHAFVRMKLKQNLYPEQIDPKGPLPAHILGNMWAQDWTNIGKYVMLFEDQPTFDVTESMIQNNWDIDQMFDVAEDFFTSIGLYEMTEDFHRLTVNNQTKHGKPLECHASAEDFCEGPNSTDFRIKMCTEVNMADLVTVHHEMGHIEYFMAYRNQFISLREAANPGFHEAIGDLIALSVSTPRHLQQVLGLTPTKAVADNTPDVETSNKSSKKTYTYEEKNEINYLMTMALQKIAFLPFGFLIDQYRWGIFDGSITEDNLNAEWWRLRTELQGVSPPNGIRGESFFDAGSKFHLPANVPYIRYFVAFIVQFQFHQELCNTVDQASPLYKCDLYAQTTAGDVLRDALEKGLSEPWPVVLKELGGSYDMDSSAMVSYFQPLMDFLDTQLENECIGWGKDCTSDDPEAVANLDNMEHNVTFYARASVSADWNFHMNTKNSNSKEMIASQTDLDFNYHLWWHEVIAEADLAQIDDESVRREYEILQNNVGTAALNDTEQLNTLVAQMKHVYSSTFCAYNHQCDDNSDRTKSLTDVVNIMAESSDFNELSYYWAKWRSETGQRIVLQYADYVQLMNEAAKQNGFEHAGQMWLQPFVRDELSSEQFLTEIDHVFWNQTFPFYQKLHAYVRYMLEQNQDYKDRINDENHLLPSSMLGNLWGSSWENIYDLVKPFEESSIPDITEVLRTKSNVTYITQTAEKFYTSIGLEEMTSDFWQNSVLEQPEKGAAICVPRNWDFYSQGLDKYRISMCTQLNQENLVTMHRQMGELEAAMAYNAQPLAFRRLSNPGLGPALGGAAALSITTPQHLESIYQELDSDYQPIETFDQNMQLNFLMKQALSLVPMVAYSYALETWRWKTFKGEIEPENYNSEWWKLRIDIEGVKPPVTRKPQMDFDIGGDYNIGSNKPFIQYFVGSILQFQLHERMCSLASPDTIELHLCDVSDSKRVGYELMKMFEQGASSSWESQLEQFLGTSAINASAMLSYFDPLITHIDQQIQTNNINVGWFPSEDTIEDFIKESEEISAAVPIIVGIVFAIMVVVVIVAFVVGQRKQKEKEEEATFQKNHPPHHTHVEMTEPDMSGNIKIPRVTSSINGDNGKHDHDIIAKVVAGCKAVRNKDEPQADNDHDHVDIGNGGSDGIVNAAFDTRNEAINRL